MLIMLHCLFILVIQLYPITKKLTWNWVYTCQNHTIICQGVETHHIIRILCIFECLILIFSLTPDRGGFWYIFPYKLNRKILFYEQAGVIQEVNFSPLHYHQFDFIASNQFPRELTNNETSRIRESLPTLRSFLSNGTWGSFERKRK